MLQVKSNNAKVAIIHSFLWNEHNTWCVRTHTHRNGINIIIKHRILLFYENMVGATAFVNDHHKNNNNNYLKWTKIGRDGPNDRVSIATTWILFSLQTTQERKTIDVNHKLMRARTHTHTSTALSRLMDNALTQIEHWKFYESIVKKVLAIICPWRVQCVKSTGRVWERTRMRRRGREGYSAGWRRPCIFRNFFYNAPNVCFAELVNWGFSMWTMCVHCVSAAPNEAHSGNFPTI